MQHAPSTDSLQGADLFGLLHVISCDAVHQSHLLQVAASLAQLC